METNLNKWIVYCTINLINDKIYIGVHKTENSDVFDGYLGCNVKINSPSTYMNPKTPFQFAVKKYGIKSFKRYTLVKGLTQEEAFKIESILVNENFVKRQDTYNASIGGNGGKLCRKIYQFDFNSNLIKEWDNIYDVGAYIGSPNNSIYTAIQIKSSLKGFYWSYNNTINTSEYVNASGTQIFQYDETTLKLIGSFSSFHEAARILNIKQDSIQRAVKCGYKTHGYYFSNIKSEVYTKVEAKNIANKPIYIYDLKGNYITTLSTKQDILDFFQVKTLSRIRDCIRSNSPYKGYQISLEKEDFLSEMEDKRNIKKKVGRYDLNDNLLETFDTVTKARETYGRGISKCLKGINNMCKGYKFKYIS